jgi:hypothetical protein
MMFLFALVMACGGTEPAPSAASPAAKAPVTEVAKPDTPNPALVEVLKMADAADGTEDKVATKCAGCALAMDGDAAHTVAVDGYTLNLCSASCKSHFEKDVSGNLKKLLN